MKAPQLFKFFITGIMLVYLSCTVDCVGNGDYARIRLVRNGMNAIFGPDAFIDRDSIRILHPDHNLPTYVVIYVDSTQSLTLYLTPYQPLILASPGRMDTLTCTTEVTDMNDGCKSYKLSSVQWNGQEICTDECGHLIEIEI